MYLADCDGFMGHICTDVYIYTYIHPAEMRCPLQRFCWMPLLSQRHGTHTHALVQGQMYTYHSLNGAGQLCSFVGCVVAREPEVPHILRMQFPFRF